MDLSVIIVSYNVSGYLRECLKSVNIATKTIDSEIFVVDNNSSDDSCEMVIREFSGVTLIRNKKNEGYAKANNQAIRLSRGRYVLLLNPDTRVMSDTFTKCIAFMEIKKDAAATGIKMIDGDGEFLPESKRSLPTVSSAFFKAFGFSSLFPGIKLFNKYYLSSAGANETAVTEVIAGAFMFIRKDVLDITGLLDEDFFMYGEDIDMSYRFIKAGYRNYYYPVAVVTHFKGCSTPKDNYDDILNFYSAMRIYLRKRRKEGLFRFSYSILFTGIFIRESLALLNRFIKFRFRG